MEKQAELLIRAALHDMANVLAGIQGVLELADPARPLGTRDKDRLDAVVEEGMATLVRARHLAMGTLPEAGLQEGPDWRAQVLDELKAMGLLFKCEFVLTFEDRGGPDRWPGALLRSYVRSAVRQALPYAQGHVLNLRCASEPSGWSIRMDPVSLLPEGLVFLADDHPGDITSRWAKTAGQALGVTPTCQDGILSLQVPRP
ncbi:hypothetical protein [Mesoterricola silvestris]|uniref:Histidine kinase n=1 Tax=Mesoterricola silvestris TaxID=2927979 RepID=A0AA48H4J9_9BACT|nr:hypothetical protein [Mesoterricola silvestris]BDU71748.1 hypothetical protein METEAL_09220 [Mesoterricola silvestris]